MWARILVAVAYLAVRMLPPSVTVGLSDGVSVVLFFALPLLAGLLIGRWWAVPLATVEFVHLAVWGDGCAEEAARDSTVECDINWWPLLLVIYVPLEAGLIGAAVAVRKTVGALGRRHRREAPTPTI
jgi:hypothetical protein